MRSKRFSKIILALLAVPAFFANPILAAEQQDDVIAQVGPNILTTEIFLNQMKMIFPKMQQTIATNPNFSGEMLNNWLEMTLMSMEAREQKLDQDPAVKGKMENVQNLVLAQELKKRQIEEKISASKEDLTKYYNDHKAEFEEPESIKVSHILVAIKGKDDAATQEARKKIEEAKARLAKGVDFGEVAKEMSDDTMTGQKGGDLGTFSRGRMVPEFDKAAFALKKGETSDIVQTKYGFHIIKVLDKVDAKPKPIEEVQEKLAQKMELAQREKAVKEMVEGLKKKYKVTINHEVLNKLVQSLNVGAEKEKKP